MQTFQRIIKYGWLNFWRNFWVSSATIGIMILALSMVVLLQMGRAVTRTFAASLEQKIDVSVYFLPDIKEDDILQVKSVLEDKPEVKEVRYVSREKALEDFQERHKDNAMLAESLKELGFNPLQATLNIKAFQASQFSSITSFLERSQYAPIIDKINYRENEKVINKLTSISSGAETAGILFSIVLGAFVILVTFNTIRLAIYSSREEISIMRLVGAGNWYIRGPFLLTGAMYGVAATLITIITFFLAAWFFTPKATAIFAEIDLFSYYRQNLFSITLLLLAIGTGLGVISSFFATRRYLNT